MAERREAGRKRRASPKKPAKARSEKSWSEGERIAKYLARCGVASRREAEQLIEVGKVFVDGERLDSPAFKVTGGEDIRVGRKRVEPPEAARLWRYHKAAGLITTSKDPEGRRTIFDELPKSLPRVMTVGRLDLNTEGLLLLTNDGELARALELPSNAFARRYRARAHGKIDQDALDGLKDGVEVDGERFAPIIATLERQTGANNWITVELAEGKKREVRRALEAIGLMVNRLIRTQYGPFELGDLRSGGVSEIPANLLMQELGGLIAAERRPALAPATTFKRQGPSAKTRMKHSARKRAKSGRGSK
ncbi:MAG: pseudouridine synthase [Pseudomonadota bacterium]